MRSDKNWQDLKDLLQGSLTDNEAIRQLLDTPFQMCSLCLQRKDVSADFTEAANT